MALEFLPSLVEIGMKANGRMIKNMARVYILRRQATSMKESTKTISGMDLEFLTLLMEICMKVNGWTIKSMATVYILGRVVTCMKENTKTIL